MADTTHLISNLSLTGALVLGDDDDATLEWDTTGLVLSAAADDSVLEIGDAATTQKSWDVIVYGNAASGADYLKWDASASALILGGAAILKGPVNNANGIGWVLPTRGTTGVPGTSGVTAGAVVFNTVDKTLCVFDGSNWVVGTLA